MRVGVSEVKRRCGIEAEHQDRSQSTKMLVPFFFLNFFLNFFMEGVGKELAENRNWETSYINQCREIGCQLKNRGMLFPLFCFAFCLHGFVN